MTNIKDLLDRVADRFVKEWSVIATAKLVFGSIAALLVLITALSVGWIVRAQSEVQIKALRSTIVSLEATIESLQKRLAEREDMHHGP